MTDLEKDALVLLGYEKDSWDTPKTRVRTKDLIDIQLPVSVEMLRKVCSPYHCCLQSSLCCPTCCTTVQTRDLRPDTSCTPDNTPGKALRNAMLGNLLHDACSVQYSVVFVTNFGI